MQSELINKNAACRTANVGNEMAAKRNQVLQSRIGYLLKRRLGDLRTRCVGSMPISPIRQEAGPSRAGRSPKSNGTLASSIRVSASSSPICRARPSGSSPSTTSAAHASNGSRKARARSSGRGCRAGRLRPTRFGSSFMRSPTISAISCARWRRPSRSRTGR